MQTAVAQMIILGIQFLIREAPGAITTIRELINKPQPTDADFEAAKEKIRNDTYEKLVPNSQLDK